MTRGRLVAAALLVVLAAPLSAQDESARRDAEQAFRDGLDARDRNDWRQAAALMRKAIQAQGNESPEKIRRGFERVRPGAGTAYTPHYFLGEALFKLDDCAGAMDEWWRSEQQGVVQKTDRAAGLAAGYATCEKKGLLRSPKLEQAVTATNDEISKTAAAADAASARAKAAGELFTAERRAQLDEASALIREARGRVEAGRKTRVAAEFVTAVGAVRKAAGVLVLVTGGLESAAAEREAALLELSRLEREIDEAGSIDGAIESRRTFLTDSLVGRRQQGREGLARARRVAESARATPVASLPSVFDARGLVSAARGHFQQVLAEVQEIERKILQVQSAAARRLAQQKFASLERGFKSFDRRAAARGELDPKLNADRRALGRRAQAASNRLEAASKAGDSAVIQAAGATADQIGSELEQLNLTFGPMTLVDRGVPLELVRGSELLFSGDFTGSLDALKALEPKGESASDTFLFEHVYLIRAAAHYELSLRAGSGSAARVDAAKASLAELRALNPGFEPDARFFSPKFLTFFRASRQADQAQASVPEPAVTP
jgi:hypothetical protein